MGSRHGLTATERFLAKVDLPGTPDGCWMWLGGVQSSGYGVFKVKPRLRHEAPAEDVGCWLAHRFAYARIGGGVLDPRLTIDHLCETKLCVNPEHMEQVTREENTRRQRASELRLVG